MNEGDLIVSVSFHDTMVPFGKPLHKLIQSQMLMVDIKGRVRIFEVGWCVYLSIISVLPTVYGTEGSAAEHILAT